MIRLGSNFKGSPTGLARTEALRSAKGILTRLGPSGSVANSITQRRPPGIKLVSPARPSAQATANLKRLPAPSSSSSSPSQLERSRGGENSGERQLMKPPPSSTSVPSNSSPVEAIRQLPWLRPPITVSFRACQPMKPSPLAMGITGQPQLLQLGQQISAPHWQAEQAWLGCAGAIPRGRVSVAAPAPCRGHSPGRPPVAPMKGWGP